MNKKKYLYAAVILALTFGLAGCGQQPQKKEEAQLVKTIQVGAKEDSTEGTYSGTVKGRYESNLSFQAGGRILSRNIQLGSVVKAGDVLMTVDPKDVTQSVNQAHAAVNQAQAQLSLAESNLSRYRKLFDQDAVSAAAIDQYQTAYDQAAAQYNQSMAALQAQQNQLSYTQLTADADGVISSVTGEVGQVVAAGQTVLTLVHSGDLEVQINVPENRVQDFSVGKAVRISFWALQNQQVDGVVREIAPMADQASRTYIVRVTIPDSPQGMQLGMTASVTNESESVSGQESFVLPLSAIYQTGNTPQVWIVCKDHTLSLKKVSVEDFGNNQVKVTGLAKGDIVVTAGVHMLTEGLTVRTESDTE